MVIGIFGKVWLLPESKYEVSAKIDGTIIGVRQVQDRGRIQIPKVIRDKLSLKDGDKIYWVQGLDETFSIVKAVKLSQTQY
jgi:AbrB family looped-hinge helix DNA binding protein